MDIFIDKYISHTIEELYITPSIINDFISWLDNLESNNHTLTTKKQKKQKKNCAIVLGNSGAGKTIFVNTICTQKKYNIIYFDLNTFKSPHLNKYKNKFANKNKYIITYLQSLSYHRTTKIFTEQNINTKNILVVDNITDTIYQSEKKILLSLLKLNNETFYCPIVFISNNKHNKTLNYLKLNSQKIFIPKPPNYLLSSLITSICKNENIIFKSSDYAINAIINQSQHDYRRLFYILNDLKIIISSSSIKEEITNEDLQTYLDNIINFKDIDNNIFTLINDVFFNNNTIHTRLQKYYLEKTLIPLMIQQNYITLIDNSTIEDKLSCALQVCNKIAYGDRVENNIFLEQYWELQVIHGIFACVLPSYIINTALKNNKFNINYKFPVDLNKTSLRQINKKTINNTTNYLKNMSSIEYMYLNKLISELIKLKQFDVLNDLSAQYGIGYLHMLKYINKINKINI